MQIRLHGTRDDVGQAAQQLHQLFTITRTSRLHPDRRGQLVRLYLDVRL